MRNPWKILCRKFFKCHLRAWLEIGPLPERWQVHSPSTFLLGFHLQSPNHSDARWVTGRDSPSRLESSELFKLLIHKGLNQTSELLPAHQTQDASCGSIVLLLCPQHHSPGPCLKPALLWGSRVLPFLYLRVYRCAMSHHQKTLYIW